MLLLLFCSWLKVQKLTEGKQHKLTAVQKRKKKKKETLKPHLPPVWHSSTLEGVCVEAGPGQVGGATVMFLYKEDPSVKKPREENHRGQME